MAQALPAPDPLDRPTGVLLVQLGTPASPRVADVRRYLREFLSDPRVIDLPAPARWLLVNGIIAPFRSPRSAHAYQSIWTEEGSPLLVHSRALAEELAAALGPDCLVELGMRYGEPGLAGALARLADAGVARILAWPLFPQHADSTTGSASAALEAQHVRLGSGAPPLRILGDFHADPGFVAALAEVSRQPLAAFRADHVLFSYHGLPESHVRRADASGAFCLARPDCCDQVGVRNRLCYRAQCFATTRATAHALGLAAERHSTSFQSRLGRAAWIGPATDAELERLAAAGVKRLAVLCPSFVADCLETLEEIGLRGRERWRELGGEALALLPCVNSSPGFVSMLATRLREAALELPTPAR